MSAPRALHHRQIHGNNKYNTRRLYSSESFVKALDIQKELLGHSGCVNALNWSSDGRYLASGSDDTNVVIWDAHAAFDKAKTISTGHTRNIFSVKFVPISGNRTLISAAGDKTIRVFDVEYGAGSSVVMEEPCARTIYRAHHDRVKRIAVEDDGHNFLTCSEDGDVRQFDLRQDNSDGSSGGYRSPLISYAKYQIDLNTISLNKANPYLLAVGGSHPCAFLHDRRMVGRDLRAEWGSIPSTATAPTQCVKKFRSTRTPGESFRGEHITALKFSSASPRELLVSWSCDDVYLFDIHGETDPQSTAVRINTEHRKGPSSGKSQKRKRAESPAENPLSNVDGLDCYDLLYATRDYLLNPPFFGRDYTTALRNFQDALGVALARLPIHCDTEIVFHLGACEDMLRALAHNIEFADFSVTPGTPPWPCEAIACIARAVSGKSDLLNEGGLSEPREVADEIVVDVTSFSKEPQNVFPSYSALTAAFNQLFLSGRWDELRLTDTAREFWLERVCRALLKTLSTSVMGLSRPDISTISDDSEEEMNDYDELMNENDDDDDDGDGDDGDGDDDDEENDMNDEFGSEDYDDFEDEEEYQDSEDEMREVDFDARDAAEYQQDITSAIHNVSPGIPIGLPKRSFSGAINIETVKDVNFFGLNDEFVMAGSDDGLLFIWNKETGKVVTILQGDSSVVNVMEGHPQANTLAVSGIDETVKIFQPFEGSDDDASRHSRRVKMPIEEILARNESRAKGIETEPQGIRLSRRMILNLANQVPDSDNCRMQ